MRRPKAKHRQPPPALSHTHKGHRITCWQRDMPRIQTRRIISNARGRVCVVRSERRMRLCFGTQKQSGSVCAGDKKFSLSLFPVVVGLRQLFRAVRAQFLHDNHHLQLPVEFICGMRADSLRIHHAASCSRHTSQWTNKINPAATSKALSARCGTSASLDDSPISHVSVISAIVTQLFLSPHTDWQAVNKLPECATCGKTSFVAPPSLFEELRNTIKHFVACIEWFRGSKLFALIAF